MYSEVHHFGCSVITEQDLQTGISPVTIKAPSVRLRKNKHVSWSNGKVALQSYPAKLKMDNGSELISVNLADWAEQHQVELEFIQAGKPTQISHVEGFNPTLRDDVLNMYAFKTLTNKLCYRLFRYQPNERLTQLA